MKKKRLLTLLVLLITAVTGVWAQDAKHLITATYREQTRSLKQPLPYATTIGELYEAVSGQSFSDLISTMSLFNKTLTGISSTKTDVVSIGELNGASTPVTVTADGKATVALRFGNYAQGIFVSVTPPLYVTMADDTKDADKWTASTDGTNFGALPIGGLKGDGSETVTLQYNGRLKVKGVKATSDAKPAATVKTITIAADFHTSGQIATAPEITIEYNEGEKWSDVAARYDWLKMYETYTVYYDADSKSGDLHTADGGVKPSDLVDPNKSYYWGFE